MIWRRATVATSLSFCGDLDCRCNCDRRADSERGRGNQSAQLSQADYGESWRRQLDDRRNAGRTFRPCRRGALQRQEHWPKPRRSRYRPPEIKPEYNVSRWPGFARSLGLFREAIPVPSRAKWERGRRVFDNQRFRGGVRSCRPVARCAAGGGGDLPRVQSVFKSNADGLRRRPRGRTPDAGRRATRGRRFA
jgi:hypothetical protein